MIAKLVLFRIGSLPRVQSSYVISSILQKISRSIAIIGSLIFIYLMFKVLGFTQGFVEVLKNCLNILVSIQVYLSLFALTSLIEPFLEKYFSKDSPLTNPIIISFVLRLSRTFIILLIPLVIIQNLGVNVGSLLAGLGLGGLAFALAAKDTLANLFGSIMIYLDKTYSVGDWVVINDQEGIIDEVGLRSTRIRTFYDSIIVIPNSVIAVTSVDNYGKRRYRRFRTNLKFKPLNSSNKFTQFVGKVKDYLTNHPARASDVELHVVVTNLDLQWWEVMIYLFLDVKDWGEELSVKQQMLMDIVDISGDFNIELAYPFYLVNLKDQPLHKVKVDS